jgi:hypothetical protein
MAMPVTPKAELAFQLQREVNRLWWKDRENSGSAATSRLKTLLLVVDDSDDSTLLSQVGDSLILVGTPLSLRSSLKESYSLQHLFTEIRGPQPALYAVNASLRFDFR